MGKKSKLRVIISGGGTGGHIFPAISIANSIKEMEPDVELLFVGAEGRMEMEIIPREGYNIVGLPIVGFSRKLSLSLLKFPFLYLASLWKAWRVINSFKPHLAVGVGGYASYPLLKMASIKKVPYLIQEQNSFAGLANRKLAKGAAKIAVAYEGMEKFFPKEKIIITGNPIRAHFKRSDKIESGKAKESFGFDPNTPLLLIVGGSLGAKAINNAVKEWLLKNENPKFGIIWQCGKSYIGEVTTFLEQHKRPSVRAFQFISQMDRAFAAATVVLSRAGAVTISELATAGKATLFVPSPNVTDDHQTHNAKALSSKGAAILVEEGELLERGMREIEELLFDKERVAQLEEKITHHSYPDASKRIAEELLTLLKGKN